MTSTLGAKPRRLIPRWRAALISAQGGEMAALRPVKHAPLDTTEFETALANFVNHPAIETAFEVVGDAIVMSQEPLAQSAAQYLVQQTGATPASRALAAYLLDESSNPDKNPLNLLAGSERLAIANMRAALHLHPRNPILWVELARTYLFVGQRSPARRAMKVAVDLAPTNRFVLRAAVRFLLHDHEPDRAIYLLDRTPLTLLDPWLLAARIATAQVAEQPPQHLKQGLRLVDSTAFPPLQTSELAGVLASMELHQGNQRLARRHFRQSLIDPTENAIAQAVFDSNDLREFKVPAEALRHQGTFEANAQQAYLDGSWNVSLDACKAWLRDEPFSSRPAVLGSFIASVALEDFALGRTICIEGLKANPNHIGLTNNLAVTLASMGALDLAEEKLGLLNSTDPEPHLKVHLVATRGLLAFRRGKVEEGRVLYLQALEMAAFDHHLKGMAAIHLALEELRLDPRRGIDAARQAEALCLNSKGSAMALLLGRLRAKATLAAEELADPNSSARSQPKPGRA